jgi:hypothetical protein
MNMKQANPAFSFKKNTDLEALPHAVPAAEKRSEPLKPGRKPTSEAGVRQKQVSAYLAYPEWEELERKLDGRPASTVLRNLILDYLKHG